MYACSACKMVNNYATHKYRRTLHRKNSTFLYFILCHKVCMEGHNFFQNISQVLCNFPEEYTYIPSQEQACLGIILAFKKIEYGIGIPFGFKCLNNWNLVAGSILLVYPATSCLFVVEKETGKKYYKIEEAQLE